MRSASSASEPIIGPVPVVYPVSSATEYKIVYNGTVALQDGSTSDEVVSRGCGYFFARRKRRRMDSTRRREKGAGVESDKGRMKTTIAHAGEIQQSLANAYVCTRREGVMVVV